MEAKQGKTGIKLGTSFLRPVRRLALVVAALLPFVPAVGSAAQVVVPNALATSQENSNSSDPFNCGFIGASSERYQQVYLAAEIRLAGTITEIRFRQGIGGSSGFGPFGPTVIPGVSITLSSTSAAPDGLSTTFADNIGGDVTTVFSGNLTLASAPSAAVPRPFDIVIPLKTGFFFNPLAGKNLLLDVTLPTCPLTTQPAAQTTAGDSISSLFLPLFAGSVGSVGFASTTALVTQFTVVPSVDTTLLAAVLPTERTGLVGGSAVTAFATILNTGLATALGCAIAPFTPVPATFLYQTTNAQNQLTGTANTPADIPPGSGQSYLFAFTPTAPFPPTEIQLSFACTNTAPAPIVSGVNTFRLRATATAAPDPVALAATGPPNDGILRLASAGAFAVATVNLGAPGLLTISADTGSVALPVTILLCETNPQTGQCLAPPTPNVQTQIATNATPTFGVFVSSNAPIPFDPATHRVQVHFEGGGGGGGTSVAVCSVPLCP